MDVHPSARKHGIADEDNEDARRVYAAAARKPSMAEKTYGKTASGKPITDELAERLADEAEAGYEVERLVRRRRGRPPIGSAAAEVESVRLEPELRKALVERAHRDHETTSAVIRKALRDYLDAP